MRPSRAAGSAIHIPQELPEGPVLGDDAGGDLTWTWSGPNPVQWVILESIDGLSGWANVETEDGTQRSNSAVSEGFYFQIVGQDGGGNNVTQGSNVHYLP